MCSNFMATEGEHHFQQCFVKLRESKGEYNQEFKHQYSTGTEGFFSYLYFIILQSGTRFCLYSYKR